MALNYRVVVTAAVLALSAASACADGIEPGLWRTINRNEAAGVVSPPQETANCLTAEQTGDLPTTFSPVSRTVNSVCAPIERSFDGQKLTWRLVCKGQLDMELNGAFDFDSPHHYTATVQTKAAMGGVTMADAKQTIEGQWVSACPQ
ncbi:MAG TPA: DUF3617 family protein [Xanthobacteraceae bacterium]|jgi:hypothetical protein